MRILGLDYGSKTVGVAVSDPLGLTAQRLDTIWRKQEKKLRQTLARSKELVDEYQIFCDLFGETEELKNRLKEGESVIRRKFQAEKFGS